MNEAEQDEDRYRSEGYRQKKAEENLGQIHSPNYAVRLSFERDYEREIAGTPVFGEWLLISIRNLHVKKHNVQCLQILFKFAEAR